MSRMAKFIQNNIVAAFRGMHVSPAKHSYAWLPRKCDYWTDRQMPDKVIPMSRYASQATQKVVVKAIHCEQCWPWFHFIRNYLWIGLLWLNVTFSNISAIQWQDIVNQFPKFYLQAGTHDMSNYGYFTCQAYIDINELVSCGLMSH